MCIEMDNVSVASLNIAKVVALLANIVRPFIVQRDGLIRNSLIRNSFIRNNFTNNFTAENSWSSQLLCCAGVLFGWFYATAPVLADVKLPSIISDNMVLQRNRVLYFWGLSDPEEIVTVIINEKRYACTADDKGAWWVEVPPQNQQSPFTVIIKAKNRITIHNVITGDVWLCAGQSNMYAPLAEVDHTPEDIDNADLPNLRFFKEEPNASGEPEFDGGGKWVVCTPETVKDFSAIGYFFGREISEKTKGVIGLVQATRAGSAIHTWLSKEAILKTPYKSTTGETDENFEQYKKLREQIEEARESGPDKELQRLLKQEKTFKKKVNTANCAYNALIAPVSPYQLKGVLWYQGENDIGEPLKYKKLFTAMIQDWRDQFRFRTLPFYYVQLPPIGVKKEDPEDSYYAELREAQSQVLKTPYVFMALTSDTGKGKDIPMHPREKKTIAHRLAILALATQYKQPLKIFGPSYDNIEVEDNAIRVHLRRAEPQLLARGGSPQGFEIAGDDKIFHWADARIDGDSIVVFNKKVKKPVAVRYSWADNPKGNLFSNDDIPLVPFRSDDWLHRKPEEGADKKPATTAPAGGAPKDASNATKTPNASKASNAGPAGPAANAADDLDLSK